MKIKKILITGGAGYIGSNVYISLVENGYNPIILDNFSRSHVSIIKKLEKISNSKVLYAKVDLKNKTGISKVFKKYKPDAVIHLAAFKSISESVENPLLYNENNLKSILNLIAVMLENKCYSIVYSSSAAIYKSIESNKPVTEDAPIECYNPYASTKYYGEEIIKDVSKSSKLKYSILRYFNPAGAHESGIINEDVSINSHNLFPNLIKTIKKEIPFLKVYGDNYNTRDGTGVRDYIHINDLANGHISALNYLINKKKNSIVNLGSGTGYSVLEVISVFSKIYGKEVKYKICPRRVGDKSTVFADIKLSKKIYKWRPNKKLEDICISVLTYYKNNNFNKIQ